MSEPLDLSPAVPDPIRQARLAPARATEGAARSGPAFEALFDQLTSRAAELEEKSRRVDGPADLPGALDTARASLEEALQLGQGLLEAYRAAQHTSEVEP